MKNKELAKNTIILFTGKIFTQFLAFLLLPLYTSILATSDYGIVDLIITYISLLAPLLTLQLEMSVFRFLIDVRDDFNNKKNIISNSLYLLFCFIIIFVVLYYIVNIFVNIPYSNLIMFMVIVSMISGYLLQVARGLGNNIKFTIASIIIGLSNILLNILFLVLMKFGLVGMLYAHILSNVLGILYLVISLKLFRYISFKKDKELLKQLLKYSVPLVPHVVIWWIIDASDRTIITLLLDVSSNGIYAIANKFSLVLTNLFNTYNLSWTESCSLHLKDNSDNFIEKTISTSLKLFLTGCLLVIPVIGIIFPYMVNINYSDAYNYIPILILSAFFNMCVSVLGAIYIAKKDTITITKSSLISGIINVVINLILIKYIGLYAASISTLVAFLSISIYRYFDIKKYVNLKINFDFILICLLLITINFIFYYLNNTLIHLLSFVIFLIIFILINKEFILSIINLVFKKKRKNY